MSKDSPELPASPDPEELAAAQAKWNRISYNTPFGNLSYSVRDDDLQQQFSAYGQVQSAKVMMERDTGRSKGFGFVEMGSDAEAQAAISGMNGQPLGGRSIVVNEARPMENRPELASDATPTCALESCPLT